MFSCDSVTAAKKRRAMRLLKKAEVINSPKLAQKAKQLLDTANREYFSH